ncbi:MAG TPA: hypothetical protein VK181_22680 [Rhizobium sp.]|nr:hypothetical protein [Rhizobium sp.]
MKVEVSAIKALDDFLEAAPETTKQAASLAMNTVIPRSGMTRYKKAIRQQVAFDSGYLEANDRFKVTRLSSPERLEAAIEARQRPTSLARFATSGAVGQEGLAVKVSPNRSVRMKKAFLVRLKAGTALNNDNYNTGLAVRLPGGAFRNKKDTSRMVRLAKDVFLLYGPSVDQVFKAVAVTETPIVLDEIEAEFYRQFGRLS